VEKLLAHTGHAISYAWQDLVFLDYPALLLQFNDSTGSLIARFQKGLGTRQREQLRSLYTNAAAQAEVAL
jgi:hypothetical protein